MNPVARLFGSLANALLDLGLPTIRQWLRDRIVHLDGIKVSGELRIDGEGAAWSHVLAEVNSGRISSRGIVTRASDVHARVSFSQVEVHDLPAISGREPKRFEHGRLSGSAIARVLPRVLSERLVLPVRIGGPLEQPRVHAGIAELLGRFLKDNRVTTFVSSAVQEARHLLGRPPSPEVTPRHDRIPHEQELDAILRRTLEAYEADWKTLAQRRAEREARRRVG